MKEIRSRLAFVKNNAYGATEDDFVFKSTELCAVPYKKKMMPLSPPPLGEFSHFKLFFTAIVVSLC